MREFQKQSIGLKSINQQGASPAQKRQEYGYIKYGKGDTGKGKNQRSALLG